MGDEPVEGILVVGRPDTTADILKSVKPIFDNSYQISKQAFILIWRIMPYRLSISGLKNLGVGAGDCPPRLSSTPLPLELIVSQRSTEAMRITTKTISTMARKRMAMTTTKTTTETHNTTN